MALALQLIVGSAPAVLHSLRRPLAWEWWVAGRIPDVPARGGLPWEGGGGESQARVDYGGQIRGGVEVTVTCYQLLGLPRKAVKDEIVKSVMELKRAEIEEGYTLDLVASRQVKNFGEIGSIDGCEG